MVRLGAEEPLDGRFIERRRMGVNQRRRSWIGDPRIGIPGNHVLDVLGAVQASGGGGGGEVVWRLSHSGDKRQNSKGRRRHWRRR